MTMLEQIISMGFFGDEGIEFLLRNNTVLIKVGSLDHFLKDSIISEFSQILGDLSEIL